jgi:hypothetical protein
VILPDGFLVAWSSNALPDTPIRLERVDRAGLRRWVCQLPVSGRWYTGVVHTGVATGWQTKPMPPWQPRQLRIETWKPLLVS